MDGSRTQIDSDRHGDAVTAMPLLVLGGAAADLPSLDGLTYTENPGQPYAGVAVIGPLSADSLARDLSVRRQFMIPIMDFSASLDGRADFAAPTPVPDALRAGLAAFIPILRRLEELPDIGPSPDAHALAVLGLAYSRQTAIRAAWTARLPQAVHYPLLAGLPGSRDLLSQLHEAELLRRRFFDRTPACDGCGSARLIAREVCGVCASSNLKEETLVHHYRCGHQAPEREFRARDYVCPKCNRTLSHFGVDYDKPGSVMVCGECGAADNDPNVRFACLDCWHETPGQSVASPEWFHYELTDAGVQAALSGTLPHLGFERLLEAYRQTRPLREFVALVEHDLDTAARYKRPFALVIVQVENIDELRATLGTRETSRVFAGLVERIVEILRETDLVAARQDEIFLAMPETPPENSAIALERLRDSVADSIEAGVRLGFQVVDRDAVAARLGGILGAT